MTNYPKTYLKRGQPRPNPDVLNETDTRFLQEHFNIYGGSLTIDGQPVDWSAIDAIEVVVAPHISGAAGWFVRNVVVREERYHIGLYSGHDEIILPNLTLAVAKYVVAAIAHFASHPVRYSGLPDFTITTDTDA
jgi:hypothetical protein